METEEEEADDAAALAGGSRGGDAKRKGPRRNRSAAAQNATQAKQIQVLERKFEEEREKNLITTRILRLEGLEDGMNKGEGIDTYDRYIYIHGTNHEKNLGSPASSGCLQVSNVEAVELHDEIPLGSHLYIKL